MVIDHQNPVCPYCAVEMKTFGPFFNDIDQEELAKIHGKDLFFYKCDPCSKKNFKKLIEK